MTALDLGSLAKPKEVMELSSKYFLCLVLVPDPDGNDGVGGLAGPVLPEDGVGVSTGQLDDLA